MGRLVWCRLCAFKLEHLGGALPDTCLHCGAMAHWSAVEVTPSPKHEWALTRNDRRLLKSFRIEVDES